MGASIFRETTFRETICSVSIFRETIFAILFFVRLFFVRIFFVVPFCFCGTIFSCGYYICCHLEHPKQFLKLREVQITISCESIFRACIFP